MDSLTEVALAPTANNKNKAKPLRDYTCRRVPYCTEITPTSEITQGSPVDPWIIYLHTYKDCLSYQTSQTYGGHNKYTQ